MNARTGMLLAGLTLLLMPGCGYKGPELAGIAGLQTKVRAFYRDHATEENGTCRAPEMRGITAVNVLEDNEEGLKLRLRYYYRDEAFGESDDPWRIIRRCTGFASREFSIEKREGNTIVTGMSGGVRKKKDWSG
ncbi:MAG: hypothetical protein R3C97_03450 [Geminicoccaceae bacterium]